MHEEAIKTYQHAAELSGGYPGIVLLKRRSQRHLFRRSRKSYPPHRTSHHSRSLRLSHGSAFIRWLLIRQSQKCLATTLGRAVSESERAPVGLSDLSR